MPSKSDFSIHIVGGVSGLAAALTLAECAGDLEISARVVCYEGGNWGGSGRDFRVAATRCQGILHSGSLYSGSQPEVARQVHTSQRRLRAIAPHAVQDCVTLAVQRDDAPPLHKMMAALDIGGCQPVAHAVVRRWYPQLRIPGDARIYTVPDATMDVRLLSVSLARRATQLGATLVKQGVARLERREDRVTALVLNDGSRVRVYRDDVVVLATGARTRSLTAPLGISIPGLTVVASHLVAGPAAAPCMILGHGGGPTLVPQSLPGGRLTNLHGASDRFVVKPEDDDRPLTPRPAALDRIHRETREWFGVEIPADSPAWLGRKTEIIVPGALRSQAHHCLRLEPLANAMLFLPGKLTAMISAAEALARSVYRNRADWAHGRSWWETLLAGPPHRDVLGRAGARWAACNLPLAPATGT